MGEGMVERRGEGRGEFLPAVQMRGQRIVLKFQMHLFQKSVK